MKKLLYIITIPDWGGAQRYVFDLAKNLQSDFEITIAFGQTENHGGLDVKCNAKNIKIHQFKSLIRAINLPKDILAVFELARYIDSEKPDIVHLNASKAGIVGSFAAGFAKHKPRIIYTAHGWVFLSPMKKSKKLMYIFLEKLASRWRDKIIMLGTKEKAVALQYKICPENKINIINNAIDNFDLIEKYEAREKLGFPQNKKIIGTIANFYPTKGLEYLIKAATLIKEENILFAVIGNGTERKNYELQISNYKLQNKLLLIGEKENAAQYLMAFDVFVLPSVKEGAPYVILEAMSAGLPIIATDVGNIREMMENYKNKIIIPPADPEKLKKAMENIGQERAEYKSNFSNYLEKMKRLYNPLK